MHELFVHQVPIPQSISDREAQAIFQAILDKPDDDVPRLAFADWCEENGHADRAELIRVQLALAAGLNLHVRLVEGTDPQHVLAAIFKAVGAALGQACRPVPDSREDA